MRLDSRFTIIANSIKRFPIFDANRIETIERMVLPNSSWRDVYSQIKLAVFTSRELIAEKLLNYEIWLQAPDYLWNPEGHDPDMSTFQLTVEHLSASL